ncbi:hypothetical protein ACVITL_005742 [Rhizobium pisi]
MAGVSGYGLEPEFADKVSQLLDACAKHGLTFKISQGVRSPQTQADYYCCWAQRTPEDIDKVAQKLKRAGAPWLASLLAERRTIPRRKDWLTSAMPGDGWHQWGRAADCYCYRDGKMVGDGSDACYKFYAETAKSLGLTPGLFFSHPDAGHVQLSCKASASTQYTWPYIEEVMKDRFGDKPQVALPAGISDAKLLHWPMKITSASIATKVVGNGFYKDDPQLISARLTPSAALVTSGVTGTLKALADVYNRVGGLLEIFGNRLGTDPVAALAVWYVESGGRSFMPGRPILRFENHVLFDNWGKNHAAEFDLHFKFGTRNGVPGKRYENHEFRVGDSGPFQKLHDGRQGTEYAALGLAQSLSGAEAGCLSASWGGAQIMGFNYDVCGFASAEQMVSAFSADERWQVLAFADFCRDKGLIEKIKTESWNDFGAIYNGNGPVYGPKIKAAFNLKANLEKLPRIPTAAAISTALPLPTFLFPHAAELETVAPQ